MSFGQDIAHGMAIQMAGLVTVVFVAGILTAAGGYGLYQLALWLMAHVVIV